MNRPRPIIEQHSVFRSSCPLFRSCPVSFVSLNNHLAAIKDFSLNERRDYFASNGLHYDRTVKYIATVLKFEQAYIKVDPRPQKPQKPQKPQQPNKPQHPNKPNPPHPKP